MTCHKRSGVSETLKGQILETLRDGAMTASELAAKLLATKPTRDDTRIHDALSSLRYHGQIVRVTGHRWARADDERDYTPVPIKSPVGSKHPGWNKIGISERVRLKKAQKPTEEQEHREFARMLHEREEARARALAEQYLRPARIAAGERTG